MKLKVFVGIFHQNGITIGSYLSKKTRNKYLLIRKLTFMENSRYALMNDSLQFFSTSGNYQSAFIIVSSFLDSQL